jgi:hypothetical protein
MRFRFGTSAGDVDAAALARQLGYTYSPTDPGDVLALPFRFFEHGGARKVSEFVSGQHTGQPAQFFVLEPETAGESPVLNCAVIGIPADFPSIRIAPRGPLAFRHDPDDMQFESDDFNHRFRVECASEQCAFSLVDGRMMEWLLAQPIPFETIELSGPWWFVALPNMMPSGWPAMLMLYDAFGAHVPPVALSSFPPPHELTSARRRARELRVLRAWTYGPTPSSGTRSLQVTPQCAADGYEREARGMVRTRRGSGRKRHHCRTVARRGARGLRACREEAPTCPRRRIRDG